MPFAKWVAYLQRFEQFVQGDTDTLLVIHTARDLANGGAGDLLDPTQPEHAVHDQMECHRLPFSLG